MAESDEVLLMLGQVLGGFEPDLTRTFEKFRKQPRLFGPYIGQRIFHELDKVELVHGYRRIGAGF